MDRDIVGQLVSLGFSQYEARAYIGLIGQEPMTGYALGNLTQVPQPKVYETLRRLADKRAVIQIGSDPARFVAVPPDHLLSQLDGDFRRRLAEAKAGLAEIGRNHGEEELRVLRTLRTWSAIERRAVALIDAAERHVSLSTHSDQIAGIESAARRADVRGVRLHVLCLGGLGLELSRGQVRSHDGVFEPDRQARKFAVAADDRHALWARAADGVRWECMAASDPLLAAVVSDHVRHELRLQAVAADFGPELEARYGPGLGGLLAPGTA
ncbi:TrmB family transcriptional regulator [Streptomyces phaeolivaceus]|nr:helix-turn-helix domain-containing protein [Streptomyces phaeolivaceus]